MLELTQLLELAVGASVVMLIIVFFITIANYLFFNSNKSKNLLQSTSPGSVTSDTVSFVKDRKNDNINNLEGHDGGSNHNQKTIEKIDYEAFDATSESRQEISFVNHGVKGRIDDPVEPATAFVEDEGTDYMLLYKKYKKKCIELQTANTALRNESAKIKHQYNDHNKKKDMMKDIIRKLDTKLKQKNKAIEEMDGKILSITTQNDEMKGEIEELKSKIKTKCASTVPNIARKTELISKVRNLYRSVRTIFLSSTKFNEEVGVDNAVCQNIEEEDPIKIVTSIEKMFLLIIRNFKSEYEKRSSVVNREDDRDDDKDNDGQDENDNSRNNKEFGVLVKLIEDACAKNKTQNEQKQCTECDDLKSKLKRTVKTIKIFQREVVRCQKMDQFMSNVEYMLSIYCDDKKDIALIKCADDLKVRHSVILKVLSNCFKKWCDLKQHVDALNCKIDVLLNIEANSKIVQKDYEDCIREKAECVSKLKMFRKWKEQIVLLIKSIKPEGCEVSGCDDTSELLQIITFIKCMLDDNRHNNPCDNKCDKLTCNALVQILCLYKNLVDMLQAKIEAESHTTINPNCTSTTNPCAQPLTPCINLDSLLIDSCPVNCTGDPEEVNQLMCIIKSKIVALFMMLQDSCNKLKECRDRSSDEPNQGDPPSTVSLPCPVICEDIIQGVNSRLIATIGTVNNLLSISSFCATCGPPAPADECDTPTTTDAPTCSPTQFDGLIAILNEKIFKLYGRLNACHACLTECKCEKEKIETEHEECTHKNSCGKHGASELVDVKSKLKLCKLQIEKYQEELSNKENYVHGMIAFLQRYLESNSNCKRCDTSDKVSLDGDLLEKIFSRLNQLGHTVDSSELIDVIKSDAKFNQELVNNCLKRYETLTHRVLDDAQTDKERLLEVIDEKNKNDSQLIDKLFEEYMNATRCINKCSVQKHCRRVHDDCNHTDNTNDDYSDSCSEVSNVDEYVKICTSKKSAIEKKIRNILKNHVCNETCDDDPCFNPDQISDSICHGCKIKLDLEHKDNCDTDDIDEKYDDNDHDHDYDHDCDHDYDHNHGHDYDHNHTDTHDIINLDDGENCDSHTCKCRVHKRYCAILEQLRECQKKNIDLMIKLKCIKSTIKDMHDFSTIINFGGSDKDDICREINSSFEYLPEYQVYFECYGYPKTLDDYMKIDPEQIELIKKEIERRDLIKQNANKEQTHVKITTKD